MQSLTGQRTIEMDAEEIRIKANNHQVATYPIQSIAGIRVRENYSIPGEEVKDFAGEFNGKVQSNYISIWADSKEQRFDFELDSHYMITQLEKVIAQWKQKGSQVITDPLPH